MMINYNCTFLMQLLVKMRVKKNEIIKELKINENLIFYLSVCDKV